MQGTIESHLDQLSKELDEDQLKRDLRQAFPEAARFSDEQLDRTLRVAKDAYQRMMKATYEADAVGGMIKVKVNCNGHLMELLVDKALLGAKNPRDTTANQDIISRGAHEAYMKAVRLATEGREALANKAKDMVFEIHRENCDSCPDKESCTLQ
jgi:DNA-binding protein YbaB